MKILFVNNFVKEDYMSDMVFHGGKSVFGEDFYEINRMNYMYDDFQNIKSLYGRGFTIYGKLSQNLYNSLPGNVVELIENKFFDKVIYPSVWRCLDYFDIVTRVYDKKDIILIDGEDEQDRIYHGLINRGVYFKREYNKNEKGVYPINFGIPEELVIDDITKKEKLISDIVPNFKYSYSFDNEKDYYNEYSKSWFAHTSKKGGWDCMRHYEIMMNGCIPIFEGLENCPENTLVNFPKKQILEFIKEKRENKENNKFILDYTKKNLTTKNIIKNIL